ncbi:DUF4145 domain-containing protein [Burkholderia ubonensis]|uniref:DUF4145 domain-containing protein n=1 Tax=Burkholderia ubonensis TaxID=101571 RepID=UPI00075875D7|nr:DUF4145 domain-containing protein [Burkholderia ubonensis]KVT98651.1 hypothetical protein WK61_09485 [Burkholderia ubonensis]
MEMLKAHCPRCDGERNCSVHGALDEPWEWSDERNATSGQIDHRLLKCLGCDTVFYWRSSWDSEDWDFRLGADGAQQFYHPVTVTTYPMPEKSGNRPDWIWNLSSVDPQLATILTQTYDARDAGALILAAVGLRTAFDRATEFLKIDPGLSLEKKVEGLKNSGFVGETEANVLATVANAGNAAAHRGWSPDEIEFRKLLEALEQFITRTVISGKTVLEIAARIPARHPRPGNALSNGPIDDGSIEQGKHQ